MSVDRLYVFNPLPESATEIQTIIMDLFSDFSQQEMDHLTSSSSFPLFTDDDLNVNTDRPSQSTHEGDAAQQEEEDTFQDDSTMAVVNNTSWDTYQPAHRHRRGDVVDSSDRKRQQRFRERKRSLQSAINKRSGKHPTHNLSKVQKTSVKELESQLGSLLLHNVHDLGEEGSKVATIEERAVEEEEDEEEAEGQYDNVEGVSLEDMAPPERFHFEDWERLGQYDNVEGVSLEDMALPERFHFEDWERVQNDLEEIFQSAWDAEVNDAAPP